MSITSIIAALLLLYVLLIFKHPHRGIYLILALLPTYQIRFTVLGVPTTFLEWLILLLAAVTILKGMTNSRESLLRAKLISNSSLWLIIAILFFTIASLVSVAASPVTLNALGIFKAYVLEGVLFWLAFLWWIDSKKKLHHSFIALGLLIGYLAIFGIYQFLTLYHLPPAWWGPGLEPRRIVSLFSYPNATALLITPILSAFTAFLVFWKKEKQIIPRSFLLAVNTLGLILLILTFSRGAWLGYAVSLLFLLFFTKYKKMLLALLAAGVIFLLLIPISRDRLLLVFAGADPASQERFKLWQGAGEIVYTQPIFGAGLMGFRTWYGALRDANADEVLNYPHNFFLNFWVETGLFGLLAVLGMLSWTFRQGRRLYLQNPDDRSFIIASFAALIALIIHGQVDAPFFKNDLAVLWWFLLAIVPIITQTNNARRVSGEL